MSQTSNPLRKHFRQPAIHLRLPSNGNFYPTGTVIMPPNGELPILPMTAVDEITSRTPDALFNGSAVMEIIGSCVPNIRDPWSIPAIDITALLIAVRLASYGHELEISSKCPQCGTDHTYTIDLRIVLDGLKAGDYNKTVNVGDLEFFFTPLSYRQINETSKVQFEDQKMIQMLSNADVPENEKMHQLGEAFRRITQLTIRGIAQSVATIKTPDAMVSELEHIEEFLNNCDRAMFNTIRDYVIKLREDSELRPLSIACPACQHQYQQIFTLDMANFFAPAS